jgi:hypothetical protein
MLQDLHVNHNLSIYNEPLKYICMSSLCQVALCSTCVVESHRDDAFHQLKELKTHVQERTDSLVIDLKSLKDKIVIANSIIVKSKANFDHLLSWHQIC